MIKFIFEDELDMDFCDATFVFRVFLTEMKNFNRYLYLVVKTKDTNLP